MATVGIKVLNNNSLVRHWSAEKQLTLYDKCFTTDQRIWSMEVWELSQTSSNLECTEESECKTLPIRPICGYNNYKSSMTRVRI